MKKLLLLLSFTLAVFVRIDSAWAIDYPFSLTTSSISSGGTFSFHLAASGTFYVDCGNGGTLSGSGVSGVTITRSDAQTSTYTCTYSSAGTKTIRFGGVATGYGYDYDTTLWFDNGSYITSISGNLSTLFPYVPSAEDNKWPYFYHTFAGTAITSIPSTLFSGYTGDLSNATEMMFAGTFNGCTNLTTIPAGLFSGITAGSSWMFQGTFRGCSSLTSIPEGLFAGITTGAEGLFQATFSECTDLTSIPALFRNITTGARYMFQNTFNQCSSLTSISENLFNFGGNDISGSEGMFKTTFSQCTSLRTIPSGLFSHITTGAENMFERTFRGCKKLQSLPESLFANITTAAKNMFNQTFYGCTRLSGYIPASMFAGLIDNDSPDEDDMMTNIFYNTNLDESCPNDMTEYETGYEDHWGDAVSCVYPFQVKFSLTTTNLSSGDEFSFSIAASGTFYVDCGDGGTLSGTGVSGTTITKSDTEDEEYTCTYSTDGVKTIRFGGTATEYSQDYGTIDFGDYTAEYIAELSGDISAIFPYLGSSAGQYPRFSNAFSYCENLTSISGSLFGGYTTGVASMFRSTFEGCTSLQTISGNMFSNMTTASGDTFREIFQDCESLTSIPSGLFSSITNIVSGAPRTFERTFAGCTSIETIPANLFAGLTSVWDRSFYATFENCTSIASIPENLFANITTGSTSSFHSTFSGCENLASIPENLFRNITTGAAWMFAGTFYGCSDLTSLPAGLFSRVTNGANYMFQNTFNGCTGLISLPENLFSGVTSAAERMFDGTFDGCSRLTGYIPPSTFAGLVANGHPTANSMWNNTFNNTQLVTECPSGTTQYITGYEGTNASTTWNGKVSCQVVTTVDLTWFDNGTTISGPSSCEIGGTFIPPTPAPRPGYIFTGWKVKTVTP